MLRFLKLAAFAGLVAGAMMAAPVAAQDKQPIKIGFGMAETGPLGPNGKSALLAMEIWVEETNAKGGLLGRPVRLVHYDDQSNPSTVPGIYSKLLDVDKVDVIVGATAPTCWHRPCRWLYSARKCSSASTASA